MKTNKPTFSRSAFNAEVKPVSGAVHQPMTTNQMDVHVKRLAQRFPYMFALPHMGMELAPEWVDIFTELCADIDLVLNKEPIGFQWRCLQRELGVPMWCWRLGRHPYAQVSVRSLAKTKNFQYMVLKEDSCWSLRCRIADLVGQAVEDAVVNSISVANIKAVHLELMDRGAPIPRWYDRPDMQGGYL